MMKDWWLMKNFEMTFLMVYNSIVSTFIFCRYTNYIKIFTTYQSNFFEDNSELSSRLPKLRAAPHYCPWVNGWCDRYYKMPNVGKGLPMSMTYDTNHNYPFSCHNFKGKASDKPKQNITNNISSFHGYKSLPR